MSHSRESTGFTRCTRFLFSCSNPVNSVNLVCHEIVEIEAAIVSECLQISPTFAYKSRCIIRHRQSLGESFITQAHFRSPGRSLGAISKRVRTGNSITSPHSTDNFSTRPCYTEITPTNGESQTGYNTGLRRVLVQ